jgi:hypothetical protein
MTAEKHLYGTNDLKWLANQPRQETSLCGTSKPPFSIFKTYPHGQVKK